MTIKAAHSSGLFHHSMVHHHSNAVHTLTQCFVMCSVQAPFPQWNSRAPGQLHDPIQQELLWLGAWHTECASAASGPWQQPDCNPAVGAEPSTGVTCSSVSSLAGELQQKTLAC